MSTAISLPFEARLPNSARDILSRDKARAQKLLAGAHPHGPLAFNASLHASRRGISGNVSLGADSGGLPAPSVTYATSVGIGRPANQYTLQIDFGSAHTWVNAYKQTNSSNNTRKSVSITYGSAKVSGTEYMDTVTLSPTLNVENQAVCAASSVQGLTDIDGMLGIGPVDGEKASPGVVDNLFAQGAIASQVVGISYQPSPSNDIVSQGELDLGGVDQAKITGNVNYVPITSTHPAACYWGIDQSISYGSDNTILNSTAGIVDPAMTLNWLATDAFQAYQQATGAIMDSATGLLTITQDQLDKLQSLFFDVGGVIYELTPNAQIWPRSLNDRIGGEEGKIYLVTADLGEKSGIGLDFINGFAFMQRFYTSLDTTNNQVGLATTAFTDADTN